jgi:hypothetical protein
VLGLVIATGGITDEDRVTAEGHFTRAIEILSDVGAELELSVAYRSYALVLAARGDHDAAATFNERAGEIDERLAVGRALGDPPIA